ncbi:MAG: 2-C-methyl-D-erythritol 4-phosphate cytidylyltransferase [Clostridiales bacterium]|nr:2-C-methyl-D-erythritol 4-phosphate cytidylyltransferase [Clostridiales bacterium]
MNTALIFAGGVGRRMNSGSVPKQFLEIDGKPIIIHTIEHFDKHPMIDKIVVVLIEDWIDRFKEMLVQFGITKVVSVIPGGKTGQESIRNGLTEIERIAGVPAEEVTVLIHDGVRPLINEKLITDNINAVAEYGNAVTVVPAIETVIEIDTDGDIFKVADRSIYRLARAPQSFILSDILNAHRRSLKDGTDYIIDSAMLMRHYGAILHTVEGPIDNIKITTPMDYIVFKAMYEAKKNGTIE